VSERRTLAPVAASFVLFGAYWGSWVVAAANVERELHLTHATLGLLLSTALLGAALTQIVGGALTERHGTSRLLGATLATWGAVIFLAAFARTKVTFAIVLLAIVTIGGLLDVVMNVAATAALAERPGSLVRFHALFNGAAGIGAAVTGTLIAGHRSWRWSWAVDGCIAIVVAAFAARAVLPAAGAGERLPLHAALTFLRREGLVLIAVAFAFAAMVENGTELWGVLLLRTRLTSGLLVGATSAVAGYAIAAGARVFIGPVAGRRGAATGVVLGTIAAAAGLAALGLSHVPWVAGAGLVLAAGGVSMCWPLLLAHASGASKRPAAVVAGVTAIGYLGFVIGPAIIGAIADRAGLDVGVLVLAGAALFVAASVRLRREPSPVGR
jgi:MFS family permease